MSGPARVPAVLAVAAVGGAGTMVVELAAVRLLAPWFGSSQAVWTNVIAVVLLALAVGYAVGGRLAVLGDSLRRLGLTLLLAGFVTAWLPTLSAPAARLFLPEGLVLHEAADVVLWGSLAASLVLFLPPAAVLGCVAPMAVEAVQELQGGTAGRAGGSVLAASTLGSLAGVFGTSHVLLPRLGLTGTFTAAAVTLFVAGLSGLLLARSLGRAGGIAAGIALLGLALGGLRTAPRPGLPEGFTELAAGESPYQSVRVVEDRTAGDEPLRYLQVNEGFDSYQSVWQPRTGLLPIGFYYNDFALPAHWSVQEGRRGTWRTLVLGLGAGTAVRVLEGSLPEALTLDVVGIEIDPLVIRFAREHLDLAPDGTPGRTAAAGLDARVALAAVEPGFDQILLDCYVNQVEIPPHLATVEFFREVLDRLGSGGWMVANLGGFGFDDPVVQAVSRSAAVAFGTDVLLVRVPFSRNFTLFARRDAPLPISDGRLLSDLEAPAPIRALLAPRELPGSLRIVRAVGEAPLTDDRCPLEDLQRRSIAEGAERLAGTEGSG